LINFLGREVQRGLVLGSSGVTDHAMECASLLEDLINGGLDGVFFGYIGLEGEELVWKLLGELGKLFTCFTDVDTVDRFCTVGEAAICYAEADPWCNVSGLVFMASVADMYIPLFAPVMAMILPSSCTVLTGVDSDDDAIMDVLRL
jgi:hypothetical protein